MKNFKRQILAAMAVVGLLSAAIAASTFSVSRHTVGGHQIYDLLSDGSEYLAGGLFFGDNDTSPTLPTATTGQKFGMRVPVYNVGPAVTQGDALVSSATGVGYVTVSTTTTGLKNVVGVAYAAISSGAKGWMIPRGGGYAIVSTTGTVNIGDILVSSGSTNGRLGSDGNPSAGSIVARAMSAGAAAGAKILALMQ